VDSGEGLLVAGDTASQQGLTSGRRAARAVPGLTMTAVSVHPGWRWLSDLLAGLLIGLLIGLLGWAASRWTGHPRPLPARPRPALQRGRPQP
jgi:hypothetical protein